MHKKPFWVLGILVAVTISLAGCVINNPPPVANNAPPATQVPARRPEDEALLRAARGGHAETIKNLLTGPNVNVDAKDENGNTPVMEAARFGHDDAVRTLLVARADVKVKNKDGKTALMLAAEGGHAETVSLLKQAGATQ